jgi:serine protease AprX
MNSKQLSIGKITGLVVLLTFILAAISLGAARQVVARAAWQQKVDPWVLAETNGRADAEFLVVLNRQADLSATGNMTSKLEKGTYVYRQLTTAARHSQPAVIAALQRSGAEYQSFWVNNMIWVRGDAVVVEAMARRSDVARIYANPRVKLDVIDPLSSAQMEETAEGVEWNIARVNAPAVWQAGVLGQGAVIGGQDTGYDWAHPALINQYRGWDGQTADHDYNWHDAIHENNPNTNPGNPCGFGSPQPCDDNGHGTHTMGTMIGDDGEGNQVGMAPEAEWIACRNMEQGWGTPATYAECYEWFIAPYPLGGDPLNDGDPARAPHVINNSWSCPVVEGCTDPEILQQVVENVRAAGIVTAHSAGNSGPSCGSITQPAAIYDASFTVGATNIDEDDKDVIAGFSARGPVIFGENELAKPDISAPGVSVRSSFPGGGYGSLSGTSMASPHVAGLVGLLISANPTLAGDVDALEQAIKDTAVPLTSDQGCGGDAPDATPNHVFGWGRIDALAAFEEVSPDVAFIQFIPVSLAE